jgi:hypothetical protein
MYNIVMATGLNKVSVNVDFSKGIIDMGKGSERLAIWNNIISMRVLSAVGLFIREVFIVGCAIIWNIDAYLESDLKRVAEQRKRNIE